MWILEHRNFYYFKKFFPQIGYIRIANRLVIRYISHIEIVFMLLVFSYSNIWHMWQSIQTLYFTYTVTVKFWKLFALHQTFLILYLNGGLQAKLVYEFLCVYSHSKTQKPYGSVLYLRKMNCIFGFNPC